MAAVLQLTRRLAYRPAAVAAPGVRLRTFAGAADIPRFLALRQQAFAREKLGIRSWTEADFAAEFLDRPWWRPEHMWFALPDIGPADAAAIGSVTMALRTGEDASRPAIHWLAVLPPWRRHGVGRLLVATVEQAAWDAGFREVCLETHAAWTAAVALYRALGYQPPQGGL